MRDTAAKHFHNRTVMSEQEQETKGAMGEVPLPSAVGWCAWEAYYLLLAVPADELGHETCLGDTDEEKGREP